MRFNGDGETVVDAGDFNHLAAGFAAMSGVAEGCSVAIVGAGAIGGWIADALHHAGWRTSLVARGATLDHLRRHGLTVCSGGVERTSPLTAGSPAELGAHDYVILAVKAHLLSALASELRPLLASGTIVMGATNGLPWWFFQGLQGPLCDARIEAIDPQQRQAEVFPRRGALGAVVHASARVTAPGRVQVAASDRLLVGEPGGGEATARVERLVAALRAGGINALASADIRREIWAKLWGNMNMNPLSALTRSGSATLLDDVELRALCVHMMAEMQRCAERLGLHVDATAEERIAVTRRLGNFKTSMLIDLEAGRSLELAPQLGAVVEIAARLDVPAPFSRAILAMARLISP
jgi:2-dehydropantoate 2-reductase